MSKSIGGSIHTRLKALSAITGKSMRELVAEWIHGNLYSKDTPNSATLKAIDNTEKGKSLVEAKDADDLFRKLGI